MQHAVRRSATSPGTDGRIEGSPAWARPRVGARVPPPGVELRKGICMGGPRHHGKQPSLHAAGRITMFEMVGYVFLNRGTSGKAAPGSPAFNQLDRPRSWAHRA